MRLERVQCIKTRNLLAGKCSLVGTLPDNKCEMRDRSLLDRSLASISSGTVHVVSGLGQQRGIQSDTIKLWGGVRLGKLQSY